jgi:hypothetical protein
MVSERAPQADRATPSAREQARAHRVHRQTQQLGNFRVAQLLKFTQQQDFAIQAPQFPHRLAQPYFRVHGVL